MSRRIDLEDDAPFLDVNDRERAIVLDLTGHTYRRVALTVDDPESLASYLRERVPDRG